jgi:hypothetical protein
MNIYNQNTFLANTPTLDFLSEPILVGAAFAVPKGINNQGFNLISLDKLSSELGELKEAFKQLQFKEQITLDTSIINQAHQFVSSRESMTQEMELLINSTNQIRTLLSQSEHPLLVTSGDFQKQINTLQQVTKLCEVCLKQAESVFSDMGQFKESAQLLNLSQVNVALFTTVANTAREQVRIHLTKFNEDATKEIHELTKRTNSQAEDQSKLSVVDLGLGHFQITTTPLRFENIISSEEPLAHRFNKAIDAAREKFTQDREVLADTRTKAATLVESENVDLNSSLIARAGKILKKGLIHGLVSGKFLDIIPYFGNRRISQRIAALNSTIQKSEAELRVIREKQNTAIKNEIRTTFAGTSFEYQADTPKEVLLAAIPLHKKDTLISSEMLFNAITELTKEAGTQVVAKAKGSLIIKDSNGRLMKIIDRGDGKARIYTRTGEDWQKIGSAWSDDALTIARRFLQNRDLGIATRGTRAGSWFIPAPSYFEKLNYN